MSRRLSIVHVQGFLMFSFMESSILAILNVLAFGLLIIHLIPDHHKSSRSVDIGIYLVVTYFEKGILTLGYFSHVFSEL